MTADPVPRLRRGLRLAARAPGEDLRVVDELLGGVLTLGHVAAGIAERIDGARSFSAIAAELRAWRPQPDDDAIADAFRDLLLLGVIDGSSDRVLARLAAGAPDRILAPPGQRAQCQGSGDCCRVYHLGPLSEIDLARLRALDLERDFPDLVGVELVVDDPAVGPTLARRGGTCVFQSGERCRIHSKLGPAAKPELCSLYPIGFYATFDGVEIYDDGECSRFGASSSSGALLADRAAEVRAMLPAELRVDHPLIRLDGKRPCDFGHYKRLLDAQRELSLDAGAPSSELLARVAGSVAELAARFETLPIELGQPERAIDAFLADALPRCGEPQPDDWEALARTCDDVLIDLLPKMSIVRDEGNGRLTTRQHRGFLELVDVLAAIADDPDHEHPLLAIPGGSVERDYLQATARQFLYSTRPFRHGGPRAGVLHLALLLGLTALGARVAAAGAPLTAAHLDHAHRTVLRTLRCEWEGLRRHGEHAGAAARCVTSLLRHLESIPAAIPTRSRRHLPLVEVTHVA